MSEAEIKLYEDKYSDNGPLAQLVLSQIRGESNGIKFMLAPQQVKIDKKITFFILPTDYDGVVNFAFRNIAGIRMKNIGLYHLKILDEAKGNFEPNLVHKYDITGDIDSPVLSIYEHMVYANEPHALMFERYDDEIRTGTIMLFMKVFLLERRVRNEYQERLGTYLATIRPKPAPAPASAPVPSSASSSVASSSSSSGSSVSQSAGAEESE